MMSTYTDCNLNAIEFEMHPVLSAPGPAHVTSFLLPLCTHVTAYASCKHWCSAVKVLINIYKTVVKILNWFVFYLILFGANGSTTVTVRPDRDGFSEIGTFLSFQHTLGDAGTRHSKSGLSRSKRDVWSP